MANHSIWNKHESPEVPLGDFYYETFDMPSVGGVCLSAPHKRVLGGGCPFRQGWVASCCLSTYYKARLRVGDAQEVTGRHYTYLGSFQAGLGGVPLLVHSCT